MRPRLLWLVEPVAAPVVELGDALDDDDDVAPDELEGDEVDAADAEDVDVVEEVGVAEIVVVVEVGVVVAATVVEETGGGDVNPPYTQAPSVPRGISG